MKKVIIIAEIGVNHNGNVRLAKQMIKKAKKSGADVVKFQTFFADEFVKISAKKAKYQLLRTSKKENHYDMIKRLELKKSDFIKIKKYCDQNKIEFLSTPYDVKSVELLEELNVKRYKIASADLVDMVLHKRILSTKKPLILSVGMSTISEIRKTIEFYKKKKMSKITLLHCVSNYPCSPKSLNLKTMLKLKKLFKLPVGFSDHSKGNSAAILAVGLGATMIEKHFTINKNLSGPDHKASASPKEFSTFVKTIREAEMIFGDDQKKCQLEEKEMRSIARKSITLKKSMKRGEIIRYRDIVMKRPGTGLNGQKINTVIGRKLKKNFKRDYQIRKQDLI
jgi:N-acetylneuraminate synthase